MQPILVNIWMVGGRRVGRTSLVEQLLGKLYSPNEIIQTFERYVNGISVRINVSHKFKVHLYLDYCSARISSTRQVYDTSEALMETIETVFGNNEICVFVYDVHRPESFASFNHWYRMYTGQSNRPDGRFYVIANSFQGKSFRKRMESEAFFKPKIEESVKIFNCNIGNNRNESAVVQIFDNIIGDAVEQQFNMVSERYMVLNYFSRKSKIISF